MCNSFFVFIALLIAFNKPVMSSWEFAVSTNKQINFYKSDWKLATEAAHQFTALSAITYDEIDNIVYFNDQANSTGTIYSLSLSDDNNHRIEQIIEKTQNELVQGIAFDPLDRMLYWTDSENRIIYQMSIEQNRKPKIFIKLNQTEVPFALAIDVCRRKLYWTNTNYREHPSIERIALDGTSRETIINSDLFRPTGIVVDEYNKRIFWVDDLDGDLYGIGSAALDGSDRKTIVHSQHSTPYNLAVDNDNVYWTDTEQDAIWKIAKNATVADSPEHLHELANEIDPKGIIIRNSFLLSQTKNVKCEAVAQLIRNRTNNLPKNQISDTNITNAVDDKQVTHAKIPVCYNYCIHGTCHVSSTGYPKCECQTGFSGERCENDLCSGYCLNGGRCSIESGEPNCECNAESYSGAHCEIMSITAMCIRYCDNEDVETGGLDLQTICTGCRSNVSAYDNHSKSNQHQQQQPMQCAEPSINKTAIFVVCGVIVSLLLVFLIVKTVRHVYKPLRPRIKKTFVVHKNVVPTPLTCRPTTEQCEITIENCCNMNICDTPCFDPKILQSEANKKEDKKMLLNNTEDLMY